MTYTRREPFSYPLKRFRYLQRAEFVAAPTLLHSSFCKMSLRQAMPLNSSNLTSDGALHQTHVLDTVPAISCTSTCSYEGLLVATVLLAGIVGGALLVTGYLLFWKSKRSEKTTKPPGSSDNDISKVKYEVLHHAQQLPGGSLHFCSICGKICNY